LSQNRRNLLHGLKLLLNTADRKGLVTFNINVSQEFSDLLYFLPDTTDNITVATRYSSIIARVVVNHIRRTRQRQHSLDRHPEKHAFFVWDYTVFV
ncbi:MAG: hypothetical protein MI685_05680, partial [Chlorobiales bacterium]|nr:hypothetical protein [Chlorobiales bacterium]